MPRCLGHHGGGEEGAGAPGVKVEEGAQPKTQAIELGNHGSLAARPNHWVREAKTLCFEFVPRWAVGDLKDTPRDRRVAGPRLAHVEEFRPNPSCWPCSAQGFARRGRSRPRCSRFDRPCRECRSETGWCRFGWCLAHDAQAGPRNGNEVGATVNLAVAATRRRLAVTV